MSHSFDFGREVYPGQSEQAEDGEFVLTATVHADDDYPPPWDREDGHGPVSDWRKRDRAGRYEKAPGERLLSHEGTFYSGSARFYDFAEACRIARRDGWGVEGGRKDGETPRAYAARAAEADFDRLRRWCDDQWSYVGVAVTVEFRGVQLVDDYECALWGIESDCGDYIADVAADLAEEAMAAARAKLESLAA